MADPVSLAQAERLRALYEEAERLMMARIARRAERGITSPGWPESKLLEVATLRRDLASVVDALDARSGVALREVLLKAQATGAASALDVSEIFAGEFGAAMDRIEKARIFPWHGGATFEAELAGTAPLTGKAGSTILMPSPDDRFAMGVLYDAQGRAEALVYLQKGIQVNSAGEFELLGKRVVPKRMPFTSIGSVMAREPGKGSVARLYDALIQKGVPIVDLIGGANDFTPAGKRFAEKFIRARAGAPSIVGRLTSTHLAAVDAIHSQAMATLRSANNMILRQAIDGYRSIVAEASTLSVSGVLTRIQATQRALDKFALGGIGSFVDKRGRSWDMSAYSEMATRTAITNAHLEGRMATFRELGFELFTISGGQTSCPLCNEWVGVILSEKPHPEAQATVSQARSSGLFHPNCGHSIVLYSRGLVPTGPVTLERERGVREEGARRAPTRDYETRLRQRRMERSVRSWKRREAIALTPDARRYAAGKVRESQAALRSFTSREGVPRLGHREQIRGPIRTDAAALRELSPRARFGGDTQDLLSRVGPDGVRVWDPERARLHDRIEREALAGLKPQPGVRQVYLTGGGPASGKGAFLGDDPHVFRGIGSRVPPGAAHIDPDKFKAMLPEYREGVRTGWHGSSSMVHEESSMLAKRITEEATRRRLNVVVDTVGDGTLDALTAKVLRNRGIDGARVVADYATVHVDIAVARALDRAHRTGRWVPPTVVRASHRAVSRVLPGAMKSGVFDEVRLWDTTVNPPTLVASAIGGTFAVADQGLWDVFLAKARR